MIRFSDVFRIVGTLYLLLWSLPSLSEKDLPPIDERLDKLDADIAKLEERFVKLGKRAVIKCETDLCAHEDGPIDADSENDEDDPKNYDLKRYSVDKFTLAENCFISSTTRVFDKYKNLIKVDEGLVDLRQVSAILRLPYHEYKNLAWEVSFTTNGRPAPNLYFRSRGKRRKAISTLQELVPLCKERARLYKKYKYQPQPDPKPLMVPESKLESTRLVRYFEDDPTQKAALLSSGFKSFGMRLKLAEEAQKPGDSLLVQTLIYMADAAGLRIADELIRKVQQGVRVEVVLDAFSPAIDIRDLTVNANTKKMYNNLMAAGIPVYGYRCDGHHLLDQIRLGQKVDTFLVNQRPHEKLWIVNKRKVILGGLNIGNDYFQLNQPGYGVWRDQDVLVEGKDIVNDMVNIFEGNTASYKANYLDPHNDSCFNPYDPLQQKPQYHDFLSKNFKDYHVKKPDKKGNQIYIAKKLEEIKAALKDPSYKFHNGFDELTGIRVVHNRPKLKELSIEENYLELIQNAQKEILIENAYFIPSVQIKRALNAAARRGVTIKIMTNAFETNDIPPIAVLARHNYKEVIDSNYGGDGLDGRPKEVEIWEWTGKRGPFKAMEMGMNHSKFMIVDRTVIFIGSYNFDPRSRNINSEVGVVFEGRTKKLGEELANTFYNSDLGFSQRVSFRDMISYRKPVRFLEAMILKSQGYQLDSSLKQVFKEDFFMKVAKYNEDMW